VSILLLSGAPLFDSLSAKSRPGWTGLLGTNALAYLASLSVTKKKKVLVKLHLNKTVKIFNDVGVM